MSPVRYEISERTVILVVNADSGMRETQLSTMETARELGVPRNVSQRAAEHPMEFSTQTCAALEKPRDQARTATSLAARAYHRELSRSLLGWPRGFVLLEWLVHHLLLPHLASRIEQRRAAEHRPLLTADLLEACLPLPA